MAPPKLSTQSVVQPVANELKAPPVGIPKSW